ncbi:hypothetical protein [Maribellus sp. YY47]|uniref:hypothetical protein n=1 Tax=Maribellus sp. YY47 TaxID=2929486 RepID=UPI0020019134|nr:hypothetical protein [Maribellus sp. YY47]MCK3685124.1 hypothetical protein [Maribellus sp. YY47]
MQSYISTHVTGKFEEKIGGYLKRSFFGFLLACKTAVTKLAKNWLVQVANFRSLTICKTVLQPDRPAHF